jgi:hypothetical protein
MTARMQAAGWSILATSSTILSDAIATQARKLSSCFQEESWNSSPKNYEIMITKVLQETG